MKKLLNVAAMALAMAVAFTSCASSGGAKGDSAPGVPHPRSYVFDVIDAGETMNLVWNQYGPNYQATPFFSKLVKKDKPLAGDTVTFKMKAVSDVDLPLLLAYPCSTSPSWTFLDDGDLDARVLATDVKAGEPFECEISWVLAEKMGADFALCVQYDNPEQEVKTGGPAVLTLERVCESTDTNNEGAPTVHVGTREIQLEKMAALFNVETSHPWINGVQDMSVISNYQGVADVTNAYGDDLPKAGDKLIVHWNAVSDVDISKMYMRAIDNSAAANWWKELEDNQSMNNGNGQIIIENVKAGEPFDITAEINFITDAVAQVALVVCYDIGDANPDGPALITMVRNR